MYFQKWCWIPVLLLAIILAGCQAVESPVVEEPVAIEVAAEAPKLETVEVTRVVEVPVEVEVTRLVEVQTEQPAMAAINPMIPVEIDKIESTFTRREYTISVVLPLSYSMTEADYPVIYVTDGDFYSFPLAMAASQQAFGQEIPEFIVVGVDYGHPNPMEWLELRELDMGPEGYENFLQFFEKELIPHIESNYRADSAGRTLAGHSLGGDFALYGLINAAATFSNFIASSPGGAAGLIDGLEKFDVNQGETGARLYLSVGDQDEEAVITDIQAFHESLVEMGFAGENYEMKILDNETHFSARARAFNSALRWLFAQG